MAAELSVYLADEAETVALGGRLAQAIGAEGAVVFLDGTLGAGKTTLCRGVLSALGHSGPVKSPTYTLVEPYELDDRKVFHFDLYRLADPEELEYMGFRDYFAGNSLCLIEWYEKGEGFLPQADILVKVIPEGSGRRARLTGSSPRGQVILAALNTEAQWQAQ